MKATINPYYETSFSIEDRDAPLRFSNYSFGCYPMLGEEEYIWLALADMKYQEIVEFKNRARKNASQS